MSDVTVVEGQSEAAVADEQLIEQLAEQARSQGLSLTGEGGLLGKLTKRVVESAHRFPGG